MILKSDEIRKMCLYWPEIHGSYEKYTSVRLIDPFNESQLNPSSYDITLSNKLGSLYHSNGIDPQFPNNIVFSEQEFESLVLTPGGTALAISNEYFNFPGNIAGMLKSKSTLGRMFISVTNGDAGWFDTGFRGRAVLELVNHSSQPIILYAGQRIGQMVFMECKGDSSIVYNGHYSDQKSFHVDGFISAIKKFYTQHLDWKKKNE